MNINDDDYEQHPSERAYACGKRHGRSAAGQEREWSRADLKRRASELDLDDTEAFIDGYFDAESPR